MSEIYRLFADYMTEHKLDGVLNHEGLVTSKHYLVGVNDGEDIAGLVLIMDKKTKEITATNSSDPELISMLSKAKEIDF